MLLYSGRLEKSPWIVAFLNTRFAQTQMSAAFAHAERHILQL
jgi:hypothetical protein